MKALAVGAALTCALSTLHAQNARPARVDPPLPPDPTVTAILNGLGDNSSAMLPPIKTAGEFNDVARKYTMERTGPVCRDYCIKAVWAPERKRALYAGANHGAPHRLNDAWEYDLPSNTWVLLFAPDPSYDVGSAAILEYEHRGAKKKVLGTKRGGPFDPAHAWMGSTSGGDSSLPVPFGHP